MSWGSVWEAKWTISVYPVAYVNWLVRRRQRLVSSCALMQIQFAQSSAFYCFSSHIPLNPKVCTPVVYGTASRTIQNGCAYTRTAFWFNARFVYFPVPALLSSLHLPLLKQVGKKMKKGRHVFVHAWRTDRRCITSSFLWSREKSICL